MAPRRARRDLSALAAFCGLLACALVWRLGAQPARVAGARVRAVRVPAAGSPAAADGGVPPNMYVLRKERKMYCYVPKANCRAMKQAVRRREGLRDWRDKALIHGAGNGLTRLSDLAGAEARALLADAGHFRFVVVRNPFARVVSAFENKMNSDGGQRASFWRYLGKECPRFAPPNSTAPADGPLLSVPDFIRCVTQGDPETQNEHWRPQTNLCRLDSVPYHRYVTVERFATELPALLRTLGWKRELKMFRMHRTPVKERFVADYFSPEEVKLLVKHYRQDFEILGYPTVPKGKIGFYSNVRRWKNM